MFLNVHTHFPANPAFEILNSDKPLVENQYYSTGIHPQDSEGYLLKIPGLERAAKLGNCLAIGEAGLDKLIDIPFDVQLDAFEAQITLSEQQQLPLILHCVKAWNEVMQVRKKLKPTQPWIFHGFRKTTLLESVLEQGLMVSIGTAILFDQKLQQVVPNIPDERLLLETDSDSEHSIESVYRKAAELKGIPLEMLEQVIEKNFRSIFSRHNTF